MEVSCTFESNNTSELSVQESNVKKNRRRRKNLSNVETLKSTSKENQSLMIESKNVNLCLAPETMVEEPLKPRWILLPGESQRYKIRFQPEETGRYEETYAVTIAEGNCITYDINVIGVADVPRLDMNPDTIFMKVIKPYLIILPKSDIARYHVFSRRWPLNCTRQTTQYTFTTRRRMTLDPSCFSIKTKSLLTLSLSLFFIYHLLTIVPQMILTRRDYC